MDSIISTFLENIVYTNRTKKLKDIWTKANGWVRKDRLYDIKDDIASVLNSLKTAKITFADIYTKGTQLKLFFLLEGNQMVVFKPQWYSKDHIIQGSVYAGNDRHNSEILAFYLSAILHIPMVPITTERIINLKDEIFPVASSLLINTSYETNNSICVYGKCYYCKKEKALCEKSPGKIHGAVIFHIPGKFFTGASPWRRTYKKGKQSFWEFTPNFCKFVKKELNKDILLDLMETAIFDFLIQNGDRHHYQTLFNKIILFDNGKGLGNPNINHLDILAPLYQCCMLRRVFFKRIKMIADLNLADILRSIPDISNIVTEKHLEAIEDRLYYVLATIEFCEKENKMTLY